MKDPWQSNADYYEILGVDEKAGHGEIQKAFVQALKTRNSDLVRQARQSLLDGSSRLCIDLLRYCDAFLPGAGISDFKDFNSYENREKMIRKLAATIEHSSVNRAATSHTAAVLMFWTALYVIENRIKEKSESQVVWACDLLDGACYNFARALSASEFWGEWEKCGYHFADIDTEELAEKFGGVLSNLVLRTSERAKGEGALMVYYNVVCAWKAATEILTSAARQEGSFKISKAESLRGMSIGKVLKAFKKELPMDPEFILAKIRFLLEDGHHGLAWQELKRKANLFKEGYEEQARELNIKANYHFAVERWQNGNFAKALDILIELLKETGSRNAIEREIEVFLTDGLTKLSFNQVMDLYDRFAVLLGTAGKGPFSAAVGEKLLLHLHSEAEYEFGQLLKKGDRAKARDFVDKIIDKLKKIYVYTDASEKIRTVVWQWNQNKRDFTIIYLVVQFDCGARSYAFKELKAIYNTPNDSHQKARATEALTYCYVTMADEMMLQKKPEQAMQTLKEGVELLNTEPLRVRLACIYHEIGIYHIKEAQKWAESKNAYQVTNSLGMARHFLSEARRLDPKNKEVETNLRWVEQQLNGLKRAAGAEMTGGCLIPVMAFLLLVISIGVLLGF